MAINLETLFNWRNIVLNDTFLPERKWTFGVFKSRELTCWPDGWQERSRHDVRAPIFPCAAKVNDGQHTLNFLCRCVMCLHLFTPADKTRVGGLQRKLFLTFLLRFAGSIVSDIMLFHGHNTGLIERWPTACCDPRSVSPHCTVFLLFRIAQLWSIRPTDYRGSWFQLLVRDFS